MGYRCWECAEEILPGGLEVWLDSNGDLVGWAVDTIPRDPAPYHPDCGEEYSARRAGYRRDPTPTPAPPPAPARKPVPKKPKKVDKRQMGLF